MKIFIGIFLCFFIFSSAGAVIEDMAVNSPYAPFPWPCDSLADCAYTSSENKQHLMLLPVIEIENSSLTQEEWNHDNNEDTYSENVTLPFSNEPDDSMNSPYAPFPWPCDSLADCAYTYSENVTLPFSNEPDDSMNSPYAPFPWPCDSLADCAYTYSENVTLPFSNEPDDFMNSPYAPFPWPCDSLADCAYTHNGIFVRYNSAW